MSERSRRVVSAHEEQLAPRDSLPAALCLAPFPSRLPLSFSLSSSSPEHAYIQSLSSPLPSSRSRGVSTRILVNTVGFSFHVGVRMLLEDITTGLACLTRFDATSLSVSLARSPACPGLSCNNAHSRDFRLHLLLEFCTRNCHSRRD